MGDGESAAIERPFHICVFARHLAGSYYIYTKNAAFAYALVLAVTRAIIHTMKAVDRMRAKLSSCAAACRGFWRLDNMTS